MASDREQWFLAPAERGNPATDIDLDGSWIEGNQVRPLIHGATYFRQLYLELGDLKSGDRVYFTDWRGDPDQALYEDGPSIGQVLADLARNGVEVRALLWRSHSDYLNFNAEENQRFGTELNEVGAEALLDQRVRRLASHHQKLFVIRHRGDPARDVAFVGGIDLSHQRRDDARHRGDPQQAPMDRRYGGRAPWHDVALEVRGPAVGDLLRCFVERWDDPHPLDRRTPYRMLVQRLARMPRHPSKLPEAFPDPPAAGPHVVQVLRTYAHKHPGYPFAPKGEYSVARAYLKAFSQARRLIYIEDQYLWSRTVARRLREALDRSADLRIVIVVPRYPDADDSLSGPPARYGQLEAMNLLRSDRVGVYNVENAEGVPIYLHAKVCIVDDVWFTVGSANFNRRSWTNDSELTCAVLDPELARSLRAELWTEHLGTSPELDPVGGFEQFAAAARALDGWYANGCVEPRPPGRLRCHQPQPVSRRQALWARPLYLHLYDPDGRPRALRRRDAF
ncbi:phosphatidylserine/phosphatidylglycerophosphate/cardiolipin synthase-like enzyme [Kribbella sp. VKM Ac-2527]|uniref:Phosphatidylserine/phosphatidylglycerophosphate/ cardiolipin synthase-like enzyme n=1 Tax=Kribbella caucasensis TaxID=2512215 RepID=A0A4R6J2Z6_9ACTN|nr:phospholipase D family protein [Kribbella sp. VKM Ac-2527]TDO29653.1 phosphatidylserine/phosphatidylglycerophosphate/cardiolipin synthase-like enzyme [Kribbella sp. VKM Ac-2527]